MTHPYLVFCDFDGTITSCETAEGLYEHILGEKFHDKVKELQARNANTSEGITEIFGMIPSADYPQIVEYINSISLREGFLAFLQFLNQRKIPFVVVSGGIEEMITHSQHWQRDCKSGGRCGYRDYGSESTGYRCGGNAIFR